MGKAAPELYNERNTLYQYDAALGWVPKPNYNGMYSYEAGRTVHVRHNAQGFRDADHAPSSRPRLAVFGDSYVYGFNVEQEDRFTNLLQKKEPGWEIYNFGVSGYGTDQELLLMRHWIDRVKPDVVLLIFCSNDHDDNSTNHRYGYYKPYVSMTDGRLDLKGQPVPKCLLYYPATYPTLFKSRLVCRLAEVVWTQLSRLYWQVVHVPDPTGPLLLTMRAEAERHGARFAVGFIGYGPDEKSFCTAAHMDCFETDSPNVFTTPGGHWNAEGHNDVAQQVDRYAHDHQWFAEQPPHH